MRAYIFIGGCLDGLVRNAEGNVFKVAKPRPRPLQNFENLSPEEQYQVDTYHRKEKWFHCAHEPVVFYALCTLTDCEIFQKLLVSYRPI